MNTDILIVCLNAVLPTFLLMAVGFAARRFKLLNGDDVSMMNNLAFKVFMPAMLFYNIYSSDISSAVRPRLLIFAVCGVLAAFALSIAYTLLFIKDKSKQSVYIQGIYRSNFVVVGLPLASALVEGQDIAPVAVMMSVTVPMYNALAVITLEVFSGKKLKPLSILADVMKNPLIIASAVGILFSALHLTLPKPIDKTVADLCKVASPLMLFLLGAFFCFDNIRRHAADLVRVCTMRLIVLPAILLSAAAALGFRGIEFAGLIGLFASSTAVASFTMAQHMGGDGELAGDIVIATSAACSVTLYLWGVLFKSIGII